MWNSRYGYNDSYSRRQSSYDSYGYGYGYSSRQQNRGVGVFGGFGRGGRYSNNYGGYSGGYGGYGGGYGGYGGYGGQRRGFGFGSRFGGGFGFGRRGYGAYSGRRGILSVLAGGVGLGIMAIGSFAMGAGALYNAHTEKQKDKGNKPYEHFRLSLLWQDRTLKQSSANIIRVPFDLQLYYLKPKEQDGDETSRYTIKVAKSKVERVKAQDQLAELFEEITQGLAIPVNFEIVHSKDEVVGGQVGRQSNDRQQNRRSDGEQSSVEAGGRYTLKSVKDCLVEDDWERLQAVCEILSDKLEAVDELLASGNIRNNALDYSRLASTLLAGLAEHAGFEAAYTVDCKQDENENEYSWCVTDVVLKVPEGVATADTVIVRVDLLHYTFDDNVAISYAYAAGGTDSFDGREQVLGSGEFTGWDGLQEHLKTLARGMVPVKQTKKIGGKKRSIPIVTGLVTKYRNARRVSMRKERCKSAFAKDSDTDVVFRNLLWFDTKSKAGKLVMKVVPFCLLLKRDEVHGVPDRDGLPLDVGFNFLPVETEYICSRVDLEQYLEEIEEGISYPLNFELLTADDGKVNLKPVAKSLSADDWIRLQYYVGVAKEVSSSVCDLVEYWFKECSDSNVATWNSALLTSVLKLAGFSYVVPVKTTKGSESWAVVDVGLTRPKSHRRMPTLGEVTQCIPGGIRDKQRDKVFKERVGRPNNMVAMLSSNSVVVRVDMNGIEDAGYGYAEHVVVKEGVKDVSKDAAGFKPFTGWVEDKREISKAVVEHAKKKAVVNKARIKVNKQTVRQDGTSDFSPESAIKGTEKYKDSSKVDKPVGGDEKEVASQSADEVVRMSPKHRDTDDVSKLTLG